MTRISTLLLMTVTSVLGQTGHITGTIVDDTGAPIQGATVSAALFWTAQPIPAVPGQLPAFLPTNAKAPSGSRGEFAIDVTYAGQYHICVQKASASVLDPCLWADPPPPVEVAAGATVSGLSVVAARGVTVNVRVHDPKGLLTVNPAQDDVRVGTFHRTSPFIPGYVSGRDPAGRNMSVIVPRGQAASISVSSSAFNLADGKGAAVGSAALSVTNDDVMKAGAAAAITVTVTDAKAGRP
jgi:hypothetical protein